MAARAAIAAQYADLIARAVAGAPLLTSDQRRILANLWCQTAPVCRPDPRPAREYSK